VGAARLIRGMAIEVAPAAAVAAMALRIDRLAGCFTRILMIPPPTD
jgi:hypothetical protein